MKDTETYKNPVKKQIKDWHTSASQRKNQEWLIIHVVRPDSKAATNSIFQVKASVLDKIRADFNLDKRDRQVIDRRVLAHLTVHADVCSLFGLRTTIVPRHGQN